MEKMHNEMLPKVDPTGSLEQSCLQSPQRFRETPQNHQNL